MSTQAPLDSNPEPCGHLSPTTPARDICTCGHSLAIHEYPMACRGAVWYPDDEVRCDCRANYSWERISGDRAAAEASS